MSNKKRKLPRNQLAAIVGAVEGEPVKLKELFATGLNNAIHLANDTKYPLTVGNKYKDYCIIFRRAADNDNVISECGITGLKNKGGSYLGALGRSTKENAAIKITNRGKDTGWVLARTPS